MENDSFVVRFGLASLATWRITHLLAEEDGPADVVVRVRMRAGDGRPGRLMDCFYCLSVWTATPFALAVSRRRRETPMTLLALSGAACLLERATAGERSGLDLIESEGGPSDVLWRQTEHVDDGQADAGEFGGEASRDAFGAADAAVRAGRAAGDLRAVDA
jgi:hypothetical protein